MALYRFIRNDALKTVQCQSAIILVLWAIISGVYSKNAGWAFVGGALVCLIANIFMYHCVFANQGASKAKRIVSDFYRGEVGKILLTAGLFAVAFRVGLLPHWVLAGYIMAQAAFWIFPIASAFAVKPTDNRWDAK